MIKKTALFIFILLVTVTLTSLAQEVSTLKLDKSLPIDGITYKDGKLYAFSGYGGKEVNQIDIKTGQVELVADNILAGISGVFDDEDNLYVATYTAEGAVFKISGEGTFSRVANTVGGAAGIAIDDEGTLYTSIYGPFQNESDEIYKIYKDGKVELFAKGGGIDAPIGIVFDEEGDLVVANSKNGKILKVNKQGEVSVFAELGKAEGYFATGHLIHKMGTIYASGNHHNKVFEISKEGEVKVLAGSGESGNKDGKLSEATFMIPNGMAINDEGTVIYVVNGGGGKNDKVRIVSLNSIENER